MRRQAAIPRGGPATKQGRIRSKDRLVKPMNAPLVRTMGSVGTIPLSPNVREDPLS